MTTALCINCGELKSGALCACPKCGVESSGNTDLDIVFSDHHLDEQTLKEFGDVIRTIHSSSHDQIIRFWAFLHVVSEHYSSILNIELKPEMKIKVSEVLHGLNLPTVKLRESSIHRGYTNEVEDES